MAITVTMYTFSKRVNSTARPTSSGTDFSCTIKQPCNIINPVIELNTSNTTCPTYNYAYISDFRRYYWIDSWTWERGLWIADLSVDALASWKTEIGSSSNYVARSSYSYDGAIMDNYYPIKAESSITRVSASSNPWSSGSDINNGTFILGVVNNKALENPSGKASSFGAVRYYLMSASDMRDLLTTLLGTASYMSITDITEELAKGIINPFEYVVSCLYFPFAHTVNTPASSNQIPGTNLFQISVGWWDLPGVSGGLINSNDPVINMTTSFTVPKHPQASARGKYCNMSPYSRYTLNFGPFGTIPIDSSLLQDCSTLNVKLDVDLINGGGKITLANGSSSNFPIINYAQLGVPIQLAQITTDVLGAATNAVGSVGSLLTGNIVGALSGIVSAAQSMLPQFKTQGSNGAVLNFDSAPELIGEFFTIVDNDNNEHGRPLCKRVTLSSYPGYLKIEEPSVQAAATSAELSQITGYMQAGFYYE